MSFWTTLMLYRPTGPPRIDGRALGAFVRAFHSLSIAAVTTHDSHTVSLKFGTAIDQDDKPTAEREPPDSIVYQMKEIEWDVHEECSSLDEASTLLAAQRKTIYRAWVNLGNATAEVAQALTRDPSPENEFPLCLNGWSLEIGPVMSSALDGDDVFQVGWISVGVGGQGYPYPWTIQHLIERAEQLAGVQELMRLCRATWPVNAAAPTGRHQYLRERMGRLWPYSRFDLPFDWHWGVDES